MVVLTVVSSEKLEAVVSALREEDDIEEVEKDFID